MIKIKYKGENHHFVSGNDLDVDIDAWEEETKKLKQQLDVAHKENVHWKKVCKKIDGLYTEVITEQLQLQKQLADYKEGCEGLKMSVADAKAEIEINKNDRLCPIGLADTCSYFVRQQREIDKLQSQLADKDKEIERLKANHNEHTGRMYEMAHKARKEGRVEGLSEYAWWKDGIQYVGTCGTTLKQALRKDE